MNALSTWLANELKERNMSMRQLAKAAGITHTTVAVVVSGERAATCDFCNAIAGPLGADPAHLFRLAGLLPAVPQAVEEEERLLRSFRAMPPSSRGLVLAMLEIFGDYVVAIHGEPGDALGNAAELEEFIGVWKTLSHVQRLALLADLRARRG
jgi:transcriptional regulator with XRE-family HTH domain